MYCKKCGSMLTAEDRFCKNCGEPVVSQDMPNDMQEGNQNNDFNMHEEKKELVNTEQIAINQPVDNMQFNNEPVMNNNGMNNMDAPMYNQQNNNMGMPMYNQPMNNNGMNNMQPMNNYQNPNMYSMPNNNSSNKGAIYVVVAIVAVAVIAGILFGTGVFKGKSDSGNTSNSGNSTPAPVVSKATYTVKYNGYVFKIPTNFIYKTTEKTLLIGDDNDTWAVDLLPITGSFSTLKSRKDQLISTLAKSGYAAKNVNVKTYGGVEIVTVEATIDGDNYIFAYADANGSQVFEMIVFTIDNDFDYDVLNEFAPVLKSVVYEAQSNSIAKELKRDESPIIDLTK